MKKTTTQHNVWRRKNIKVSCLIRELLMKAVDVRTTKTVKSFTAITMKEVLKVSGTGKQI